MDSVLRTVPDSGSLTRDRAWWPEPQYPDNAPKGYIAPEDFPKVTQALIDRGYAESHILGILGQNYLNLATAVWKPVR